MMRKLCLCLLLLHVLSSSATMMWGPQAPPSGGQSVVYKNLLLLFDSTRNPAFPEPGTVHIYNIEQQAWTTVVGRGVALAPELASLAPGFVVVLFEYRMIVYGANCLVFLDLEDLRWIRAFGWKEELPPQRSSYYAVMYH